MLLNSIIGDLKDTYDFIEQGKVNTSLIKWVSGENIKYMKHKKHWDYDFSLKIPELTKKLRFEFGEGESSFYQKSVDLKSHVHTPGVIGNIKSKTIFSDISHGTEIDAATIDDRKRFYFKPTPKDLIPRLLSSKQPAEFGVGIYAIRFFSKPSKKLLPEQLAIEQFAPKTLWPGYTDKDMAACITALVIANRPWKAGYKYLLSTTVNNHAGVPTFYALLPPISDQNQFNQYFYDAHPPAQNQAARKEDIWSEILPVIKSHPNCQVKILFPYQINDNGYNWAAAEIIIQKTTAIPPAVPVVTYNITTCMHHPNRTNANPMAPGPLTVIHNSFDAIAQRNLQASAPGVYNNAAVNDDYYMAPANQVVIANNFCMLNTIKDIRDITKGLNLAQTRMHGNEDEVIQEQFDIVYDVLQTNATESSLFEFIDNQGKPISGINLKLTK